MRRPDIIRRAQYLGGRPQKILFEEGTKTVRLVETAK